MPAGARAGDVRLGDDPLLPDVRPAGRRAGGLRRRQAVDVEAAAFRGAGRDQRAARPPGPADQADDDLGGRDPQLLHPRVPDEAGRAAGPVHLDVVRADARSGATTCSAPSIAGRTIRRMGGWVDGDGAGRVPAVAHAGGDRPVDGRSRARSCSSSTTAPAATGAARSSTPRGSRASTAGRSRSSRATTSGSPWPTSGTSATRSSSPRRRSSPATSR